MIISNFPLPMLLFFIPAKSFASGSGVHWCWAPKQWLSGTEISTGLIIISWSRIQFCSKSTKHYFIWGLLLLQEKEIFFSASPWKILFFATWFLSHTLLHRWQWVSVENLSPHQNWSSVFPCVAASFPILWPLDSSGLLTA